MTRIRIKVNRPDEANNLVPVVGRLAWRPSKRRVDDETVIAPVGFNTLLTPEGEQTIQVEPTTHEWVWQVIEFFPGGLCRYLAVPDTDQVIEYIDLVEVDPATLEPTAQPEAAWWLALQEVAAGSIDPEIVETAVDIAMLDHVNSPNPHPAYDVDIPPLDIFFENGLI